MVFEMPILLVTYGGKCSALLVQCCCCGGNGGLPWGGSRAGEMIDLPSPKTNHIEDVTHEKAGSVTDVNI